MTGQPETNTLGTLCAAWRSFNQINEKTEILFTKEGRKEMVKSIKIEMEKAVSKENYFTEEEKKLINAFINKIRNELKSTN